MGLKDSIPLSLFAAADLYGKTWLFGKVTSTGFNVCTVAGEKADGVIGESLYPQAGIQVAGDGQAVYNERIFLVTAGGSFNAGDELTTDVNAKAVAAGATDYVNAVALEAGIAGRIVAVMRPVAKPGSATTTKLGVYTTGGAISPLDRNSQLTADGTAYTLANGPAGVGGTTIEIECVAATGDSVLTIASPDTQTLSTYHFHAVSQMLKLLWTGTVWRIIGKRKTGALTVTVGTTITTGYKLTKKFNLSVAATVHSTGATKQIPDGDFDGEMVEVRVTSATASPVGDIDGNFTTLVTAANTTHLQALDATTDYVVGLWSAAAVAYLRLSDTGITFA